MYTKICKCRICGNENLQTIVNLGMQKLTGVFPLPEENVGEGPLELVKCIGGDTTNTKPCGLVQLRHSCDLSEMYGENYGYRSGLNSSMVKHLSDITDEIKKRINIQKDDLIIDIGSNDSTLLQSYEIEGIDYLGIDPTGIKFKKYYPDYIQLVSDFFTADNVIAVRGRKKAKVITSISMFYDLENPILFAKDISKVLDKDGMWILEQSYLPAMLETKSYDTICQEHLEFYCLKQIEYIVEAVGMKVIDVVRNDTNGGSFRITVAHKDSIYQTNQTVEEMRAYEVQGKFDELLTYENFNQKIEVSRKELLQFLQAAKKEGKKVFGYGASTKGNVLLQYCGITAEDIVAIAEVNEDKYGCVTPGTNIPIVSEEEAKIQKPDYFLVLPWHFKNNILEKEREYIKQSGCKFVFPLPNLEIISYE